MTFSYEFLKFQCGNHDTKEKLEYYHSFIMRLLGELETLRETMCTSCQQKCPSSKSAQSENQFLAAPDDSMRALKQRHVEDSMPETFYTPAASPCSSSLPINEEMVSDSPSLVKMTTEPNNLSDESNDRIFYVERDDLADPTIDVTFVYSFRHEKPVRCVSFSRDGRYLAAGTGDDDKDGSIVIYEVESRKKYCELREYATQYGSYTRLPAWFLCFSSDGRYLAVVDGAKRMIIWDVQKKRIRSIFHWSYQICNVHFSPDGHLVAFWASGGVVVLNMRDYSTRMLSEGSRFDFNPSGRLIATWNDGVLLILDVRTGKAVKRWNPHGMFLARVKFTLDGKGLLCVYMNMVEQWDVSNTEPVLIRKFDLQRDYFDRISISPDHRLLASDNVLLDVNSGKRQCTFKGHNDDKLRSVDLSTAGTYLAICDFDGFVSLWRYNYR